MSRSPPLMGGIVLLVAGGSGIIAAPERMV